MKSVAGRRDASHSAGAASKRPHWFARRVPQFDRLVFSGCQQIQRTADGDSSEVVNRTGVSCHQRCCGTSPDPRRVVRSARQQRRSIAAQRDAVDDSGVAGKSFQLQTARGIPQPHDAVGTRCGNAVSIGRRGRRVHGSRVSQFCLDDGVRQIPDMHEVVGAGCYNASGVARNRDGCHGSGRSRKRLCRAGCQSPQTDRLVGSPGQQHRSRRVVGQPGHGSFVSGDQLRQRDGEDAAGIVRRSGHNRHIVGSKRRSTQSHRAGRQVLEQLPGCVPDSQPVARRRGDSRAGCRKRNAGHGGR